MTKTQPTHKKLPRGKLLYGTIRPKGPGGSQTELFQPSSFDHYDTPFAIIPCHTPAQARQIVKAAEFLRLPEEEKVERVAEALRAAIEPQFAAKVSWARCVDKNHYRLMAPVFLAAMGMGGTK